MQDKAQGLKLGLGVLAKAGKVKTKDGDAAIVGLSSGGLGCHAAAV